MAPLTVSPGGSEPGDPLRAQNSTPSVARDPSVAAAITAATQGAVSPPSAALGERTVRDGFHEVSARISGTTPLSVRELAAGLLAHVRERRPPSKVSPNSMYRLQLGAPNEKDPGFTFQDAAEIVGYLAALGQRAVYTNPLFDSVTGTHGYDNVGMDKLHPGLGAPAPFFDALEAHGLGLVLDLVPNHEGIEKGKNAPWQDVLKHGLASTFAHRYDIDWKGDPRQKMEGRVLVPFLGENYDLVLAKGQLELRFEKGELRLKYWENEWPMGPSATAEVAERWERTLAVGSNPYHSEAAQLREAIAEVRNVCRPAILTARISPREADARRNAGRRLEVLIERFRERPQLEASLQATLASYQSRAAPKDADINAARPFLKDWHDLNALVQGHCSFKLSHWKDAASIINYRRFFDINGLACIRVELPEVFESTHVLIREIEAEMAARALLFGVRIDHVDGLYDPEPYLERLQSTFFIDLARQELARIAPERQFTRELEAELRAQYAALGDQRYPLIFTMVEKILGHNEKLPEGWNRYANRTTGYDALNAIQGVFVPRHRHADVVRIYAEVRGEPDLPNAELLEREREYYAAQLRIAKERIIDGSIPAELKTRTRKLKDVADLDVGTEGIPEEMLQKILREVIIAFDVYRTYINGQRSQEDFARITAAVDRARTHLSAIPRDRIDWVMSVLRQEIPPEYPPDQAQTWRDFVHSFQQITGPMMAKSIEDTLFYRYNAFIALNEVGGEPMHFGWTAEEFHAFAKAFDGGSEIATHDTKWSSAARARLNLIAEQSGPWWQEVRAWFSGHAQHTAAITGEGRHLRLHPDDQYRIYQTVLALWPSIAGTVEVEPPETIIPRVQQITEKALREAKLRTDWINEDHDYERLAASFIEDIFRDPQFVQAMHSLVQRNQAAEWADLIGQRVLQYSLKGSPTTYMGEERHRLMGVDSDNRVLPPFEANMRSLVALQKLEAAMAGDRLPRELWKKGARGQVFQFVLRTLNRLRNSSAELFKEGDYEGLGVSGPRSRHAIASWRSLGDDHAVFVSSMFSRELRDEVREARRTWTKESGEPRPPASSVDTLAYCMKGTTVALPPELHGQELLEVFSGRRFLAGTHVDLGTLLSDFPHAVLVAGDAATRFLESPLPHFELPATLKGAKVGAVVGATATAEG